jgi:uncharacterized protein (DUF1800 family)
MARTSLILAALLLTSATFQAQDRRLPAQTGSDASARHKPHPAPKAVPLTPLSEVERAQQMLNRFTFGARPGDLEHVLTTGSDHWFEQQLNPASIPDAVLDHRLYDYPTLTMQPEQALTVFPDHGAVQRVAEGKLPYPTDPALAAMYEVQVYKFNKDRERQTIGADGKPMIPPPTDAQLAERKTQDQATAARIAGDLFSLPRNQRMTALIQLPVPDRIAFTTYVSGDQRNLLLAEFSPREREVFYGMAANVGAAGQIVNELSQAKLVRAILSERQVQEVMTDFWFNHFNIYIGKDSDQWYTTSYERDDIRKHALGKFRDLLLATATSPAMMVYLDNWLSIGPDSIANGVNPANPKSKKGNHGLNENYGREVMELHTVGVNGGYSQTDVTTLSAILTGWGVERPGEGGPFLYDPNRHEPGTKDWFGYSIDDQGNVALSTQPGAEKQPQLPPGTGSWVPINVPDGMRQGVAELSLLAASPRTAHFICYEIAQRFVADDPPPALVDRLAATYLSTDGDIKAILRALVTSPEFNSKQYFRNKVKTPMEFLVSAFRTTATDPSNPGALVGTIKAMGMPLYYALPPTGYYITADHWMNSTALVDRLNFAYALTSGKFANQKFDSARVLALGLMAQPSGPEIANHRSGEPHPGGFAEASLTTLSVSDSRSASPALASGPDLALQVLECALIGGEVSAKTNRLIRDQVKTIPATSPTDSLNLLTALVMGSPEFQQR